MVQRTRHQPTMDFVVGQLERLSNTGGSQRPVDEATLTAHITKRCPEWNVDGPEARNHIHNLLILGQDKKMCQEVERGIWISIQDGHVSGDNNGQGTTGKHSRLPNTGNVLHYLQEMCKSNPDNRANESDLAVAMKNQCPRWKANSQDALKYIQELLDIGHEQNLCYPVGNGYWTRGYRPRKKTGVIQVTETQAAPVAYVTAPKPEVVEERRAVPVQREIILEPQRPRAIEATKPDEYIRSEIETTDTGEPDTASLAYKRLPNVGTVQHNLQILAGKNTNRAVSEDTLTRQMIKKCPNWNVSESEGRMYIRELLGLAECQNLCYEVSKGHWRPGYRPRRQLVQQTTVPLALETPRPTAVRTEPETVQWTTSAVSVEEKKSPSVIRRVETQEETKVTVTNETKPELVQAEKPLPKSSSVRERRSSAREAARPVVLEDRKPSVREERRPVTREKRKSVAKRRRPSIREEKRSSVREIQATPVVKERKPSVREEKKPSLREERKPVIRERRQPIVAHEGPLITHCIPAIKTRPIKEEKRASVREQQASPVIVERKPSVRERKPSTRDRTEPSLRERSTKKEQPLRQQTAPKIFRPDHKRAHGSEPRMKSRHSKERKQKTPRRFFEKSPIQRDSSAEQVPTDRKVFGQSSPVSSPKYQPRPEITSEQVPIPVHEKVEPTPKSRPSAFRQQIEPPRKRPHAVDERELEALMGGKVSPSTCQICGFRYGVHLSLNTHISGNSGTYDVNFLPTNDRLLETTSAQRSRGGPQNVAGSKYTQ